MLQVSISQGTSGDTVRTFTLKLEPRELCFADKKEEGTQTRRTDTTVSINVGGRNLYLVQVSPLCWLKWLCRGQLWGSAAWHRLTLDDMRMVVSVMETTTASMMVASSIRTWCRSVSQYVAAASLGWQPWV